MFSVKSKFSSGNQYEKALDYTKNNELAWTLRSGLVTLDLLIMPTACFTTFFFDNHQIGVLESIAAGEKAAVANDLLKQRKAVDFHKMMLLCHQYKKTTDT